MRDGRKIERPPVTEKFSKMKKKSLDTRTSTNRTMWHDKSSARSHYCPVIWPVCAGRGRSWGSRGDPTTREVSASWGLYSRRSFPLNCRLDMRLCAVFDTRSRPNRQRWRVANSNSWRRRRDEEHHPQSTTYGKGQMCSILHGVFQKIRRVFI